MGRVQLRTRDGRVVTVWGSVAPGPTSLSKSRRGRVRRSRQRLRPRQAPRSDPRLQPRDGAARSQHRSRRASGPGQLLDPSGAGHHPRRHDLRRGHGQRARRALHAPGGQSLRRAHGCWAGRRDVANHAGWLAASKPPKNATSACSIRAARRSPSSAASATSSAICAAPAQITLDAVGYLRVADRGNNRVQQFGPNRTKSTTYGYRCVGARRVHQPDRRGASTARSALKRATDTQSNRVPTSPSPPCAASAALGPLGSPPAAKLPTLPLPL